MSEFDNPPIVTAASVILAYFASCINSLSAVAFHYLRRRTQSVSLLSFQLLVVVEVIFCLSIALGVGVEALREFVNSKMHFLVLTFGVSRDCALLLRNLWTMCLATFRLIAVAAPLKARSRLTLETTRTVFGVMLTFAVIVSVVKNFYDEKVRLKSLTMMENFTRMPLDVQKKPMNSSSSNREDDDSDDSQFLVKFMQVSFFIQAVIPPVYVLILSCAIVLLLIYHTRSRSFVSKQRHTQSGSANSQTIELLSNGDADHHQSNRVRSSNLQQQAAANGIKRTSKATITLLVLATCFVIFESPSFILAFLPFSSNLPLHVTLLNRLVLVDSFSNFFVFWWLNKHFRKCCVALLMCRVPQLQQQIHRSTGTLL